MQETSLRDETASQVRTRGRITADTSAPRAKAKGVVPFPVHIPDQTHVLLNIANANLTTQCARPAFRVGACVDDVSLVQSIIQTHPEKEHVDWHFHPLHKWKLIPATSELSPEAELARITELWEGHQAQFEQQKKNFEEYCEKKKNMAVDEEKEMEQLQAERVPKKDLTTPTTATAPTGNNEEDMLPLMSPSQLATQRYAVVGIINPVDSDDCMINVFAAFDTEADAIRYTQDTLADVHKTLHLQVLTMYAWVFPDVLYTSSVARIPTSFRHEQLHNIMDYKTQLPGRIEAYERHCESLGMEPKFTDVTGNAEDASVPSTEFTVDTAIEDGEATVDDDTTEGGGGEEKTSTREE